jgi:hypothetical protein
MEVCVDPRCGQVALAVRCPASPTSDQRCRYSTAAAGCAPSVHPMPQLQTLALLQLHQKQIAVGLKAPGPILAGRMLPGPPPTHEQPARRSSQLFHGMHPPPTLVRRRRCKTGASPVSVISRPSESMRAVLSSAAVQDVPMVIIA